MKVVLSYGKTGLPVEVPDDNVTIVRPVFVSRLDDEQGAIVEALNCPSGCKPLRDMVQPSDTVAVAFCDATRPVPNKVILPIILDEMESVGVRRDRIVLVNALGTHRPSPLAELVELLGEDIDMDQSDEDSKRKRDEYDTWLASKRRKSTHQGKLELQAAKTQTLTGSSLGG